MGRWDFLAEQKPQELKEYVLDQVAGRLADELRAFPPPLEWIDLSLQRRYRDVLARPAMPEPRTLRVACELSRRELLREYELIDSFWRSGAFREHLPTALEESTARFVSGWLVDASLEFQETAKGKFSRRELVGLVERVEDRLLPGDRFRL
jgi:hypothetical protein